MLHFRSDREKAIEFLRRERRREIEKVRKIRKQILIKKWENMYLKKNYSNLKERKNLKIERMLKKRFKERKHNLIDTHPLTFITFPRYRTFIPYECSVSVKRKDNTPTDRTKVCKRDANTRTSRLINRRYAVTMSFLYL